eukprot:8137788-Lingulodinium_polyedra.AAC.1
MLRPMRRTKRWARPWLHRSRACRDGDPRKRHGRPLRAVAHEVHSYGLVGQMERQNSPSMCGRAGTAQHCQRRKVHCAQLQPAQMA